MSYSYPDPPNCCSSASAELKLYQAFIFSVPILFTFILLFLFYLFYLRRQRVDWASLRMRPSPDQDDRTFSEAGLKREVREMLPIIVFKETFSITDTQCSVCLGDYQAEDKLQQIPACGHTFHMNCIDHWLATHTTCPLCRLSLVPPPKTSSDVPPSTDPQIEAQQALQAHLVPNEHPSHVVNDVDIESGVERERGAYSDLQGSKGENGYCDSNEEDQLDAATAIGNEEEEEEKEEEGVVVSVVVVPNDVEAQTSSMQVLETSTEGH
ncbi:hypothetical protein Sjap_018910 [Stephania japonica]|uniref:RING-type E3 ubiquitin transferase n=1 Tax=Stephania japonica TaxID=461633 RepID=A0AAP0I8Z8_9MAGN